MVAILLCILAFGITNWAARRSLVAGITAMLGVGYLYGIVRANVISPFSHFIFDASLAGLYLNQLSVHLSPEESKRSASLRMWMVALIAWPVFVCFMPFQTPLISLVGLRGNVFFLPLCLLAVRMKSRDWLSLSSALAGLNLLALCFGLAEYFLGIERFFPVSPVTAIIYASRDVAGFQFFRIPATFTNAHAYASTMVTTLPLLIGAWTQAQTGSARRLFLLSGAGAAILGVLLASARVHAAAAGLVMAATLLQSQMPARKRMLWGGLIAAALVLLVSNERFERVTTLADTEAVEGRIQGSVNRTFLEVLFEYPMGNGLGGGGTSIPSFLEGQVNKPVAIENEYARILLEQGVIGLLIWLAFTFRFLASPYVWVHGEWSVARRLTWVCCAVFFGTSMIGTGLMTSIPTTGLLLLGIGWVMMPPAEETSDSDLGQDEVELALAE